MVVLNEKDLAIYEVFNLKLAEEFRPFAAFYRLLLTGDLIPPKDEMRVPPFF